jgi:hypothetical protein
MLKAALLTSVTTLALVSAANACDPSTGTSTNNATSAQGAALTTLTDSATDTLPGGGSITVTSTGTITVNDGSKTVTLPPDSDITVNNNGSVSYTPPPTTQAAAQPATGASGSNASPATQTAASTSPAAAGATTSSSNTQTATDPSTASAQTGTDPNAASTQTTTDPAATASTQTAADPTTPASTQTATNPSTQTAATSPTAATGPVSRASGGMTLIGVNISGGEFGKGQVGTNYIYPSQAEISFYAAAGMTVIRVPFLIENVMPNPGTLSTTDVTALKQVVQEAAAAGMDVDLDAHDYGMAWGQLITPGSQTEQQFDNFWQQMAGQFAGNPNVIFGIMNEPNQQTPQQQAEIDNDAIQAIRSAGANQEILVPGTSWTGAWTWVSGGNAAAINPQTIQDPDNNWVIEVHQYLDADGSGTNPAPITDPNIGVERLTAVTQWAQQNGAILFLGEFGAPQDSQSQQAVANMLSYMEQNSSVWQGGTMWGAGAWWGNYFQGIEPPNLQGTTPGLSTLEQFVPKAPGA